VTLETAEVPDLRFGFVALPEPAPGYFPAGDAQALMLPSIASPARRPIAGVQYTGSYAAGQRFVVRVPADWNGSLIVAGTGASRCEFSNDLIWGEFALANGYAFAASNKGIPYNAVLEPAAGVADSSTAYPVPFDSGGLLSAGLALQFGMLWPQRVPIDAWNADYRALVVFARELLKARHAVARRVYAVGVSNGGAQVRSLLERAPELVDGGVEWAGVYWTAQHNLLDDLPAFLREMPGYIASGFADRAVAERLREHGFPADVVQDDPAHPSLYAEFYSNVPPFYADVTVFAYALLIDPLASSAYADPACVPNALDPARLPATCNGRGLALPETRAAYVPSAAARAAIGAFAHDGDIGKPLVSIAGTHDVFITPARHALAYAQAVAAAQHADRHQLYLVAGGTHVDTFAAFGYGLQAQAPFAWAAFEKLVRTVEGGGRLDGSVRTVQAPSEIA
jgi:hypothetical protein